MQYSDLNELKKYIRERENPVILDKKKEFIYFPVNKVLQTTIARKILKDRVIIYKNEPDLWNKIFNEIDLNNVFKFGLVRNPYSRFESAFNYLKKQNKLSIRLGIKNRTIKEYISDIFLREFKKHRNPFKVNAHYENQYKSFVFNKIMCVDKIIKIENTEELNIFLKELNNNYTGEKYNKSEHKEILDEEDKKIIYEIYKNDFINLNYEK